jgi:hypothetical protein
MKIIYFEVIPNTIFIFAIYEVSSFESVLGDLGLVKGTFKKHIYMVVKNLVYLVVVFRRVEQTADDFST